MSKSWRIETADGVSTNWWYDSETFLKTSKRAVNLQRNLMKFGYTDSQMDIQTKRICKFKFWEVCVLYIKPRSNWRVHKPKQRLGRSWVGTSRNWCGVHWKWCGAFVSTVGRTLNCLQPLVPACWGVWEAHTQSVNKWGQPKSTTWFPSKRIKESAELSASHTLAFYSLHALAAPDIGSLMSLMTRKDLTTC